MIHFKQGNIVHNINPASKYYGLIGIFHHELQWTFQSIGDVLEPACDVAYPGHHGPYGYPYVAQRVSDLEFVQQSLVEKDLVL